MTMVKNLNSQETELLKGFGGGLLTKAMEKAENVTFRKGSLSSLSVNAQNHFN